jgi:hypothetical protein
MEEDDGHWAMQPLAVNNEIAGGDINDILLAVQHEEMAWADGEELPPPLEGHNSIKTIVSLSEGVSSHASEEVNERFPQQ